jgi:YD repeat-containing protein
MGLFGAGGYGRRRKSFRGRSSLMVLAVAVPLALPVASPGGGHLHLPAKAEVRSAIVGLVDLITDHHTPAPTTPEQQAGTAAGKAHSVPAAVTRAIANAEGREAGAAKGQRPAYRAHGPATKTFTTGPAAHGFNAATSAVTARSAKADLYKNADGSYTQRIYQGPVNYKTSDGDWAPINTTLGETGTRWQEKANDTGATFAAQGSDEELGTLSNGTQSVSFSLAGAATVTGAADGSSITYADILPGTDVTETATATGISESLTLRSPNVATDWIFPLKLTGLAATLDNNEVILKNASGATVWVIPQATARSGPIDLAKADSQASDTLTYQLISYDGGTALEMTLDKTWLEAKGRVFPVTVDPSISPDAAGSTYVEQDEGTDKSADEGGSEFLPSGYYYGSSTDYQKDIDFLDFKGEIGNVITDYHVTAATLELFDVWAYTCDYTEYEYAYQVTQSWAPTDTLTYPGPTYTTQDATWGGVASSAACDNTSGEPGMGSWIGLTFNSSGLALLNNWTVNDVSDDYGFAVAPSLTDNQMWKQFDSANDGDISSSDGGDCTKDCEPYLEITYTADVAPQINSQYPPDNYNSSTLTPELIASGTDADDWPDALEYDFTVFNSSGTQVATSGDISSDDWTVPSGDLSWGETYYWTVTDFDGIDTSTTATTSYFSTPVPQPLITSGLSQNDSDEGFDASSGDWTTSATDAQIDTVGPSLEITRDYNSEDPRSSGAFGAGWSSVLDMKVSPGQNSSSGTTATEVVTYPDGEEVGFGLTSSGTYVAPEGRYATLAAVTSGGFTLTDKNDTVYTFTQSLGSDVYGTPSIADAFGHTETFSYNSSDEITTMTSASGRALHVTWEDTSGTYPHVATVVTDDATTGESSTAKTWNYSYSGDELTTVCPPVSTTACTVYTYTSGSDYPDAVQDSGPHSYWRLDETSGTTAASSVQLNEGTDDATYSDVTLGASSALAGSSATSASFNGTDSAVTLPVNLVSGASYQSVSMWFKTSSDNGVLFSYQSDALSAGTTGGGYTPSIYVGSDGKLHAEFWYSGGVNPMSSSSTVTDGKWHLVTLTASGNTQTLYLDGVAQGTLSGAVDVSKQANDYVGAGFLGGEWPDESDYETDGDDGYATYFNGDISDVAFWDRPLTAAETTALYSSGTTSSDLLTKVTRPSGSVYQQVSYDPLTSRVTSVTDDSGGTWTIHSPTVTGSSQVYVASVLGAEPQDYWRLGDTGTTTAVNQLLGGTATYSDVTQGESGGEFSDTTTDSFNGTDSQITLPSSLISGDGDETISLWFKTTTAGGVLFSDSETSLASSSTTSSYTPMLYVGTNGHLYSEFWEGSAKAPMESTDVVDDGAWHNVVLAAGTSSQVLYVDGAQDATLSGTVAGGAASSQDNVYVGAGFIGGGWPEEADNELDGNDGYAEYFTGDIGEVAFYPSQLTADQVTGQWDASEYSSGLTPVETDTVTDPGGHTLMWVYDALNGDRILSQTDARGETTTYGYDVDGFQDETVNPDGDVTQTGYDVRGNVVSQTTCQDQVDDKCSTDYYTYYPDDTSTTLTPDPRNDVLLTSRDGRSSSATDTTYETTYTYNSLGELTDETDPLGEVTQYLYTDGSTDTGGFDGAIPPKGLEYEEITPAGAVTTTLYYGDGDVAQVTDPDGLRTTYEYDGLGQELGETEYSDSYPDGLTTSYIYNADGQITSETDPPVTNRVTGAIHTAQTSTTYDADGDVTSQTVADTTGGDASRTATRTYNSYDELTSETDADGNKTSYTYDEYGNVATETDPDGNVTAYTYDGDGNLLTTTLENYTGSPSGSQSATNLVEESRSYDPAGQLASVTDAMGRVTEYGYTDNGLLATVTDVNAAGTASFVEESDTYDAAGNLTAKVTNNGETTTDYTVNAGDEVTSEVLDPSGLDRTTTISYTPDDQES